MDIKEKWELEMNTIISDTKCVSKYRDAIRTILLSSRNIARNSRKQQSDIITENSSFSGQKDDHGFLVEAAAPHGDTIEGED